MKTAEEIALDHGLCRCDEAYTKRGLTAPDCPYHSFAVEEAMIEYARQFQPQWIKINRRSDLPKEDDAFWFMLKDRSFYPGFYRPRDRNFVCGEMKFHVSVVIRYAPIIKPQPPKED